MSAGAAVIKKQDSSSLWKGAKPIPFLIVMTIGIGLWSIPTPEGLTDQAWHLFAIFTATVVSLIAQPLPVGAIAIIVMITCLLTKTLSPAQAFESFGNQIIWLVFAAMCIARGFIKTGLGARVAYYFISILGKSTLGLSYGLIGTELLLAPFVPSNTARAAGIVFPIVSSLNKQYESCPTKGTHRKIGAYLIKLIYQTNVITSSMFLTAMAGNPLVVNFASQAGVTINWTTWALASLVPGFICLALLPLILYKIYPPELKHTPDAPRVAKEKLAEMGPMSFDEKLMLGTFGLLLTLWIFGSHVGVDATTTALIGLAVILFFGVLTWDDILKEHTAWNTMFWMAILLMLADNLNGLGMMGWFSQHMQGFVSSFSWVSALAVLALVYFYSHYFFASMTAHISAMYGAFVLVAVAAGGPPFLVCMMMAPLSVLCAGITHYGTGAAPVMHAAGFVKTSEWWKIGFIMSVVNLLIWSITGPLWWKLMGWW